MADKLEDRRGAGNQAPPAKRGRQQARRPLLVGLGVSGIVHVVLVLVYALSSAPLGWMVPEFPVSVPEVRASGIEVVRLAEIDSEDPSDPDDPLIIEQIEVADPAVEAPDLEGEPDPQLPIRYRSAGERLRAGQGDPRLWSGIDPELVELTEEQGARLRLLSAIESMNDSARAIAEAEAAMLDWTTTDEDGNRWGVSPGKIHLGKVSIPMPFGFSAPPDYDGSRGRRAFEYADIDRAAGQRAVEENWKERQKVMQRRREAERAARVQAEAERVRGGARASPPDTVRRRR